MSGSTLASESSFSSGSPGWVKTAAAEARSSLIQTPPRGRALST